MCCEVQIKTTRKEVWVYLEDVVDKTFDTFFEYLVGSVVHPISPVKSIAPSCLPFQLQQSVLVNGLQA